jgi:predicted permease
LRLLSDLAARIRSLLLARREDAELAEEIRFHIDRDIEKNLAAGMDPKEARRQAHIMFGGVERMRERTREARGVSFMENVLWELPGVVRSLRASWVVSMTAVVTIGLGVALTTSTFSIVYGVLLNPLPYPDAQRLVAVTPTLAEGGSGQPQFEAPDLRDFRDRQTLFESVDGYFRRAVSLTDADGFAQSLRAGFVTAGALETLGVQPYLGRTFRADEDFRSDIGHVVLGHETWTQRFGGDPEVIGRRIRVDDRSLEVIGVMPSGFTFPVAEEIWLPMDFDMPTTDRGSGRSFAVFGRARPDATVEAAEVEAAAIARRISAENPDFHAPLGATVRPLRERHLPGGIGSMLRVMLAAVLGVLLIACANVANLLLARTLTKGREVSVRSALGATRYRIAQRFLLETLMLSTLGGLLGLALTALSMDAVARPLSSLPLPRWVDVSLALPVLGLVVLLVVVVAALAGGLPALQAARADVATHLRDGVRGSTGGRARRWPSALVSAQVAMSSALLIGAGLLAKSITELRTYDMGYDASRVLSAAYRMPVSDYPTPEERSALLAEILERASALPGAAGASVVRSAPGTGPTFAWDFAVEGEEYSLAAYPTANGVPVAHAYFDVMDIELIQGRDFTTDESRFGTRPVVIVNETLARRHLGPDPIGRRVRIGADDADAPWYDVVGVVEDTYVGSSSGGIGLEPYATAQMYVSWGIAPYSAGTLLVASDRDPGALSADVRALLREVGPTVPVYDAARLEDIIEDSTWAFGLFGTVFTVFGAIALLLSAVGLYGVTAFSVAQRQQEMSVRMAMGARADRVVLMVLADVGRRLALGVAVGLVLSVLLGRGMRAVLFGVDPMDVTVYGLVLATTVVTGLLAALVPASRAARTDPARCLAR